MSKLHSEIGPELRQLAQVILDRLDPAVRATVAATVARGDSPGACQQVWCPVCALAAMVSGEQHPLLDVIAEHSVTLLTAVRAFVGNPERPPPDGDGDNSDRSDRPSPGRYQRIPIRVEE